MRGDAMKLYYNPQSRAVIAKWMLDECAAKYEIVPIDFAKREHKTPEFLKINHGKLPARRWRIENFRRAATVCISVTSFQKRTLRPKSARRNVVAISR
jgi:glutathione S-transferase